jgi:DNA polymerase-3 subunit epsilon
MSGYSVIDLETTGLSPAKHHRIVEIGVVEVSPEGEIEDEWSTLVNPGRDIANSYIHGITASDVVTAPRFEDVADPLLDSLRGRTVVAHNAPFDLRFLQAELAGVGRWPSHMHLTGLCTMQWSSVFIEAPSRRLADCCSACGISLTDAHSALADAHATAELLGHYLSLLECSGVLPWQDVYREAVSFPWPASNSPITDRTAARGRLLPRESARALRPDAWLDQILSRMPRTADQRVDSYLETLERALLDQFLAEHEKTELIDVAQELGLSRGQVLDLHATYLWAMAEIAVADGVVTDQEHKDLESVALVLGLRSVDIDRALRDAEAARALTSPASPAEGTSDPEHARHELSLSSIALEPGDRIVFTGSMSRDRSSWEDLARSRGYVPGGITKKTALVVAADPNSQSGKAAKARSYGIPIITEDAFARLVGA